MLRADRVRPMDSPVQGPSKPLPLKKTVRLALNRGAIFVLVTSTLNPDILAAFRLADWELREPVFRYTIVDHTGRWLDGVSDKPLQLDEKLVIDIRAPFQLVSSSYGLRPVFTLKLPFGYRVHHLAYLRRKFPQVAQKLSV